MTLCEQHRAQALLENDNQNANILSQPSARVAPGSTVVLRPSSITIFKWTESILCGYFHLVGLYITMTTHGPKTAAPTNSTGGLGSKHPRLRDDVDYVLETCIQGDGQEAVQFCQGFRDAANRGNLDGFYSTQFGIRVAEIRLDDIFMITAPDSQIRVWISWLLSSGDIPGTAGLTLKGCERLTQAVRHSLQRCQFLTQ